MLDLIFLVMFIIIFIRSLRGYYNETLCNTAMVIGIIAALVGAVQALMTGNHNLSFLNALVFVIAIAQRYAARYLAKLYNDKIEQSQKELDEYLERHSRKSEAEYHMDDEDFDNEEVRFGKGGFQAYNEDYTVDDVTLGDKK